MIEEAGTVVAVRGEEALVETRRQSACGSCGAAGACGTAALSRVVGRRMTRVRALNRAGARVGDSVIFGLAESALVEGSLMVYALPLAGLVGGAVAGALLFPEGEIASMLLALGGFLAALGVVRRFSRRIRNDSRYQPVVLRVERSAGAPLRFEPRAMLKSH